MKVGLGEALTSCPVCPAALPSGTSAYRLMRGDPKGLAGIVGHTIGRASLIGVGMAVAGERKHLVRNALGGALGIEAFVLVWAAWKAHQDTVAESTPPAPVSSTGLKGFS